MTSAATNKLYLNQDGILEFVCRRCGLNKHLDTSKLKHQGRALTFRCRCKAVYEVDLRRYYRKPVRLPAECKHLKTGTSERVVLKDISLSGVCFTAPHFSGYRVGDALRLRFTLDNQRRTPMALSVEVRNIRGRDVGTEILHTNYNDKDLYYYLLP